MIVQEPSHPVLSQLTPFFRFEGFPYDYELIALEIAIKSYYLFQQNHYLCDSVYDTKLPVKTQQDNKNNTLHIFLAVSIRPGLLASFLDLEKDNKSNKSRTIKKHTFTVLMTPSL